jgi:hypothetical protein
MSSYGKLPELLRGDGSYHMMETEETAEQIKIFKGSLLWARKSEGGNMRQAKMFTPWHKLGDKHLKLAEGDRVYARKLEAAIEWLQANLLISQQTDKQVEIAKAVREAAKKAAKKAKVEQEAAKKAAKKAKVEQEA